jgi:hypothetical protein
VYGAAEKEAEFNSRGPVSQEVDAELEALLAGTA